MSAESEVRAVLIAHAPLLAAVPSARISIDAVMPTATRPYIAFSKQQVAEDSGIGSSRANAIVVAGLVRDALRAGGMPSDRGSAGYDAENDLEVEIVTVDWFDV